VATCSRRCFETFQVTLAESGPAALEAMSKEDFDVL